jgi:hypothetical protein
VKLICRTTISAFLAILLLMVSTGIAYAYDSEDDSVIEVGGVSIDHYPGLWTDIPIADETTTDFVETLESFGYTERFNYNDLTDEAHFSGNDAYSADGVDIFWYTGHGSPGTLKLSDDQYPIFHSSIVGYDEVLWGDTDLEWVMLYACSTLQYDFPCGPKTSGRFAQSLNGAHMICGARTDMQATLDTAGFEVATYLTGGYSVMWSWFYGCETTQSSGVTLAVLVESTEYYDDCIWGAGTTLADPTLNGYYTGDYWYCQ